MVAMNDSAMMGGLLDQIVAGAMAGDAPLAPTPEQELTDGSSIEREAPDPAVERQALVKFWQDTVSADREHWEGRSFKKMRLWRAIAAGRQWPKNSVEDGMKFVDEPNERYVANITLRHIHTRTASIYGKNPKIVARRRRRLLNTVWDGTHKSLQEAMMMATQVQVDPVTGAPAMPDPNAMAIIADATASLETTQQLDKIAQTLEILMDHQLDEQSVPFKVQMKATIRRALTTGVGYVKLGYQRVMGRSPDIENKLTDMSQQLATIERLSADLVDQVADNSGKEAEQLRLAMKALETQEDIVVREGLLVSYPDSTSIIPDRATKQLRGFVGGSHVTEEFFLSGDRIKELYNVDVGMSGGTARAYQENHDGSFKSAGERSADGAKGSDLFCVWVIYNKLDGLVYTLCDGHSDFLEEPRAPEVTIERFYPWFALAFNEVDDEQSIFPPSDVSLIYDMQMELNRARQGLREHRRASRPKTVARKGVLSENDKATLEGCPAHSVIELEGLSPTEKVGDLLQSHAGPEIDARLYETQPAYEDILRVVGQQEANFGGTSGATATETSIAEGSRMSSVSSNIDDLDEFLTEFARSAGQVLLKETGTATVREVVGPGAVWPDLTRDQIAKEIYLEVEAASTGRPNKTAEIQNFNQMAPLLMQIPGVNPEWLAREGLRRLDDRMDLTDAFRQGMPSIMAMNRMSQMAPAGADDPNAQGDKGAANDNDPAPEQTNVAPRQPDAPPPMAA